MAVNNTIVDSYTAPTGTPGVQGPMDKIPPAEPVPEVGKSTTTTGASSKFSSSASVVLDNTANTAKTNATSAITTPPPTPVKSFSTGASVNGQPQNLDYNHLPPGFQTTPPVDANGKPVPYNLISTQYGPVYQVQTPTSTTTPTGAPQGYTASQPDSQGNVTYNNTTTGHSFTIPAGTANPSTVANNVVAVQSQIASANLTGYNTTVAQNGDITVTGPDGSSLATISPEVASSPASLAEAMNQFTTHSSSVAAATAAQTASTATENASYNSQLQQLQQQQDAAVAEELAASGGGLGSNSGAVTAVKQRFDGLIQDLTDAHNANLATISSNNATAIANADSTLSSALTTITENAKQTVISTTQTNLTNAQNALTKLNLPTSTIAGLTLNAQNQTGNPAADAVIAQYIAGGMTPAQALALTQSGSIAANKANQTDWLNTVKNFPVLTQDISGMSLADAQKDPFYGALIQQGANVMGSPDAAWAAIQSGSASALAALKTQNQIAFEAADTQRMLAEAEAGTVDATAADKWVSVSNAITKNVTSSTTFKAITAASDSLANVESAMSDPGSVSDSVLVQSLAKLSIGGSATRISQSTLNSITGGASLSDYVNVLQGKVSSQGGALSPSQRTQALNLASALYKNYINDYKTNIYDPYTKQLNAAGVPSQFQTLPSPTDLSLSSLGATASSGVTINGTTYTSGQTITDGSTTLTVQSDGTLQDQNGNKYDSSGNPIQ